MGNAQVHPGAGTQPFFPGCQVNNGERRNSTMNVVAGEATEYDHDKSLFRNSDRNGLYNDDDDNDDDDDTMGKRAMMMSHFTLHQSGKDAKDEASHRKHLDVNKSAKSIKSSRSGKTEKTSRTAKSVTSYASSLDLDPPILLVAPDVGNHHLRDFLRNKKQQVVCEDPILTAEEIDDLRYYLPSADRFANYWCLRYSPERHGVSMETMYRQIADIDGPIIVVIESTDGDVFGGYCNTVFAPHQARYYGDHSCFVFNRKKKEKKSPQLGDKSSKEATATSAHDSTLEIHPWAVKDHFFLYSDHEGIGMGGGSKELDGFAWWVQNDFLRGVSGHSSTFDNPRFTKDDDFVLQRFQVFSLDHERRALTLVSAHSESSPTTASPASYTHGFFVPRDDKDSPTACFPQGPGDDEDHDSPLDSPRTALKTLLVEYHTQRCEGEFPCDTPSEEEAEENVEKSDGGKGKNDLSVVKTLIGDDTEGATGATKTLIDEETEEDKTDGQDVVIEGQAQSVMGEDERDDDVCSPGGKLTGSHGASPGGTTSGQSGTNRFAHHRSSAHAEIALGPQRSAISAKSPQAIRQGLSSIPDSPKTSEEEVQSEVSPETEGMAINSPDTAQDHVDSNSDSDALSTGSVHSYGSPRIPSGEALEHHTGRKFAPLNLAQRAGSSVQSEERGSKRIESHWVAADIASKRRDTFHIDERKTTAAKEKQAADDSSNQPSFAQKHKTEM